MLHNSRSIVPVIILVAIPSFGSLKSKKNSSSCTCSSAPVESDPTGRTVEANDQQREMLLKTLENAFKVWLNASKRKCRKPVDPGAALGYCFKSRGDSSICRNPCKKMVLRI